MKKAIGLSMPKPCIFSFEKFTALVLIFFAASILSCQTLGSHKSDQQMINFLNQNERDFSRLAKMAVEDENLWRISTGNLIFPNKFEIHSEDKNFRDATEDDINSVRRNEYADLMRKTNVSVLSKQNISDGGRAVFLSSTKKDLSLLHSTEKGYVFCADKITEGVFDSLDDKNNSESYRPPNLDFRAVKPDWYLYYQSE